MNVRSFTTFLVTLLLFSCLTMSQDKTAEDVRWSMDPSTKVRLMDNYTPSPDNYVHQTKRQVVNTGNGTLFSLERRPYPHTAT
jgi:hypothetical protein